MFALDVVESSIANDVFFACIFMTEQPLLHDLLVPRSPESLTAVRVQNELCCAIKYDRTLRLPVLVMKGDLSSARVEIPCEHRLPSLRQSSYSLIIFQTYLDSFDAFALEVAMRISPFQRVDLTIGTQFNKATVEDPRNGILVSKMPLIIPRNRWVQVVFHLSGIVTYLLELSPIESINTISLSGTCKTSRLMMSNDEDKAISATPNSMVLFAVPAYAPPIWQTAAAMVSPAITNSSRTLVEKTTNINALGTCVAGVGESSKDPRVTSPLRHDGAVKPNMSSSPVLPEQKLSRLDVVSTSPPLVPCEPLQENRGPRVQRGIPNALPPSSPRQVQHQEQAKSFPKEESMSYIRLVDRTTPFLNKNSTSLTRNRLNNSMAREPTNGPVASASAAAAVSSAAVTTGIADMCCAITGWGKAMDLVGGGNTMSPSSAHSTGKGPSLSNYRLSAEKGAAGGGNKSNKAAEANASKVQQQKKTAELKRRPNVATPSKRRKGGGRTDAQLSGDNDNTSSATYATKRRGFFLRRRRLRKRMKLLREAQMSARRIHEMKKLPASEVPIDPLEEALMMVEGEILDVMKEPRCGYGFGYLGVLRESGGFEADEDVDTRLKGALTLELSEEEEEEEENSGGENEVE